MEKIRCTRCGAPYEIEKEYLGKVFACEKCGKNFLATTKEFSEPTSKPTSMKKSGALGAELSPCLYCGEMISPKTLRCPKCGAHKLYLPLTVITYWVLVSLIISLFAAVVILIH